MESEKIRKEIKHKISGLSKASKKEQSETIAGRLLALFSEDNYEGLLAYSPMPDEVNLNSLYQDLLSEGYSVYFPRVKGDRMDFYPVGDLGDLKPGAYGIKEPQAKNPLKNPEDYLAVVPGIAFDECGNRIGHGKGYYDKYLSEWPDVYKVGVCFNEQLTEIDPMEWDIPMNAVLTEKAAFLMNEEE